MGEFNLNLGKASEDSMRSLKPYDGPRKKTENISVDEALVSGVNECLLFNLMRANYVNGKTTYEFPCNIERKQIQSSIKKNKIDKEVYSEEADGLYIKYKDEKIKVANFNIRIDEYIKIIQENELWEFFRCKIYCDDTGLNECLYIMKEKYKDVFKEIRRKLPETTYSNSMNDVYGDYLADVYCISKNEWKEFTLYAKRGWRKLSEGIKYETGIMDPDILRKLGIHIYEYSTAPIPNMDDIDSMDKYSIFIHGSKFLEVGMHNKEIVTIFLFSHIGYLMGCMESINFPCQFLLYISGRTNSYKTSVAKVVTNVFETAPDKKAIRYNSTIASLYEYISKNMDGMILIDDYSHTEQRTQKDSLQKGELIVRAVGDGIIPTKLNSQGDVCHRRVRVGVIATGETDLDLGASSQLRMFKINFSEDKCNKNMLSEFQRQPEIMRNYFALFLKFLEENTRKLCEHAGDLIWNYRSEYKGELEPRQVDMVIWFKILIYTWEKFGEWAGMDAGTIFDQGEMFEKKIMELVHYNEENSRLAKPAIRFIYALSKLIATDKRVIIAENENAFVQHEKEYLGFYAHNDCDEIWLDFDTAYKMVKNYWRNLDHEFMVTGKQVKESLYEVGLIRTSINSRGRTDFVMRARKGTRRYMLVIFKDKYDRALEEVR